MGHLGRDVCGNTIEIPVEKCQRTNQFPGMCAMARTHTNTHVDWFACAIYCTCKNCSTVF